MESENAQDNGAVETKRTRQSRSEATLHKDSAVWEEPEATKRGSTGIDWDDFVKALMANPGKWALVAENAPLNMGRRLRQYQGVETTARGVGKSRAQKLYARYTRELAKEQAAAKAS